MLKRLKEEKDKQKDLIVRQIQKLEPKANKKPKAIPSIPKDDAERWFEEEPLTVGDKSLPPGAKPVKAFARRAVSKPAASRKPTFQA